MATTPTRSPFTAPGETRRGLWRALGEVTGCGLMLLLAQQLVSELSNGHFNLFQLVPLSCLALGLLAVRRRWPTAALLGMAATMGLLPAAGMAAAVTAYTSAKLLAEPRQRSAVLLASTALTPLLCAATAPALGIGERSFGLAIGGVLATTTLVVPGLVGASAGQQERLLVALRERAAAAEAARRLADSESRTHERSRIAAEMHDLVGHRLSLISLHTGGLEMALQNESPELRDEAALLRRVTRDAMRELREVLGVLGPLGRDTGTDALTDTTGTRADVEALAEESRHGGIPVELTWDGPDLDVRTAQVRRAVHRVVRESLTNVHRYATGAHVTIAVTHTDTRVEVVVRNGHPPVTPEATTGLGTGRGLVGLRERVSLLGGTLDAGPTPVGGYSLTARMPANPDPAAALAGTDAPSAESSPAPRAGRAVAGVQRRVVASLTGLLGLVGVGVMMLLGLMLISEFRPQEAYPDREEPRIGMSRAQFEQSVFSSDDEGVRAAATGHEPPRRDSVTHCRYPEVPYDDFVPLHGKPIASDDYYDSDLTDGPGHLRITRYCFRGDTLATIDSFTVPVVSQTPPWETP
ncbi:sensor histidine kinase [Streptomyces phytohabitans]|uniref:sensor histidine kinase n=1 Tax=Streptomyces phytohabitans TaxID=1150371 RepID=UPI00345BD54C